MARTRTARKSRNARRRRNRQRSRPPSDLQDSLRDPLIPQAPDPSGLLRPSPYRQDIAAAHQTLDTSEQLGGHARAMHDGLSHADLDARGKRVASTFLGTYDQDKSFHDFMAHGGGAGVERQVSAKPGSGYASGIHRGDASGRGPSDPNATWQRTAALARVSERQQDGSVRHYNAKVKRAFAKFTRERGTTRVQTFFPTDYEELPAPLPGGQVPTDVVQGDTIDEVRGRLRKTETEERYGGPALGRVVEATPSGDGGARTEEGAAASPGQEAIPPRPERPADWSRLPPSAKRRFRKKLARWKRLYGVDDAG